MVCDSSHACVPVPQQSPLDVLADYASCYESCGWEQPDFPQCQQQCLADLPTVPSEHFDALVSCVAENCAYCYDAPEETPLCLAGCVVVDCKATLLAVADQGNGSLGCADALSCHFACGAESLSCAVGCLAATDPDAAPVFLDWLGCYKPDCPGEPGCSDEPDWECFGIPSLSCYHNSSQSTCSAEFGQCQGY